MKGAVERNFNAYLYHYFKVAAGGEMRSGKKILKLLFFLRAQYAKHPYPVYPVLFVVFTVSRRYRYCCAICAKLFCRFFIEFV